MADLPTSEPTIDSSRIVNVTQGQPLVLTEEDIVRDRLPFVIWTKDFKSIFPMPNHEDNPGVISSFHNRWLLQGAMIHFFTADEVRIILAIPSTVD